RTRCRAPVAPAPWLCRGRGQRGMEESRPPRRAPSAGPRWPGGAAAGLAGVGGVVFDLRGELRRRRLPRLGARPPGAAPAHGGRGRAHHVGQPHRAHAGVGAGVRLLRRELAGAGAAGAGADAEERVVRPVPQPINGPVNGPGEYPYTRGIRRDMYRGRLWTMRQYAGFGDAATSNQRYKYLLSQGTTGLSIAFDLPTQLGLDSDAALARGEVGRVGVAIDSITDMEQLLEGLPLGSVSASMTINATAATLLALYIAV